MNRYTPGNEVVLLSGGKAYFPALCAAIDAATREVWLETYIFADDDAGRKVADVLLRAAARGVVVRVLVDGWGAKHYLTDRLEDELVQGGVKLLKYRPEVQPWHFRSHRLRRLHRKIAHVDGDVAFVGGINLIDDMNTPGHRPPRVDFATRLRGPIVAGIVATMQRLWALNELVQFQSSDVPLFPDEVPIGPVGRQTAKFTIRDNLRHRRDIERAYLAGIRTARHDILLANAYFFPGIRFRRALIEARERGVAVTLLLQAKVEYKLLHFASRALYGQFIGAGIAIQEYHLSFLHAKVAVIDDRWATVGSSNIDPYSLLMSREANVFIRDGAFAGTLRGELVRMIAAGARPVEAERWRTRSILSKAACWIAYGIVRVAMGMLGYGGNEWWRGHARKH